MKAPISFSTPRMITTQRASERATISGSANFHGNGVIGR